MKVEVAANKKKQLGKAVPLVVEFLHAARSSVEAEYGEEYADAHPELVAAFMQAASGVFGSMEVARALKIATYEIAGELREVNINLWEGVRPPLHNAVIALDNIVRTMERLERNGCIEESAAGQPA